MRRALQVNASVLRTLGTPLLRHLLVILLCGAVVRGEEPKACEPKECLRFLSSKVAIEVVKATDGALVGQWTEGSGLSGSDLFLFSDHTYVFTEWADIWPETIHDKGTWSLSEGLLLFTPDTDVNWKPSTDRRFLLVRERAGTKPVLFGLDRRLEIFADLIEEEPNDAVGYFRVSTLSRATGRTARAKPTKKSLMECCWRPEAFRK